MATDTRTAGRTEPTLSYQPGRHILAIMTLVVTFVLILAGGNVTTKQAGLAVPDWPLSFGSLNPPGWTSQPGVRDEHGHRLIGATVGILMTALALWTMAKETRRGVVMLAIVAWLAVVVQGVMGGLRVTERSLHLAIAHGCFAHAFFCMLVGLAMVTSRRWHHPPADEYKADPRLRLWLFCMMAGVFGQLILGALRRHTATGTAYHITGAVLVGVFLAVVLALSLAQPSPAIIRRRVMAIFALYTFQMALGLVTLVVVDQSLGYSPPSWVRLSLPTIHVGVAALILALVFSATLWAYRLGAPRVTGTVQLDGSTKLET